MSKEIFRALGELIQDQCRKKDFSLLGPISERHGSWEWDFHKRSYNLDRFLIVALTNLPKILPLENSFEYALEIWIGAEDGNLFVRRLIQAFPFYEASLDPFAIHGRIKEGLFLAMDFADALNPADVVEVHPLKRFRSLTGKEPPPSPKRAPRKF